MNRRRKDETDANPPRKASKDIIDIERAVITNPGDMAGIAASILERSEAHYKCPKCGCRKPIREGELGTVALRCSKCRNITPVMVPMFAGDLHDQVVGYQLTEFTGGLPKMYVLGGGARASTEA